VWVQVERLVASETGYKVKERKSLGEMEEVQRTMQRHVPLARALSRSLCVWAAEVMLSTYTIKFGHTLTILFRC
jgi:hypothetical protein